MKPRRRKLLALLTLLLIKKQSNLLCREPRRTSSLSGHSFIRDILYGNPTVSLEFLRMERHVFQRLCVVFREKMLLQDSRYVPVEEQMAMFLMTIGHNHKSRVLKDIFQYSGETIHRHFHAVLVAMMKFSMEIIKPQSYDNIPIQILQNPRFYPYFKGCIGAIDGTLVHAMLPVDKQVPYRGIKGDCMQNVVASCSLDMLFTYVMAGWEGTAHDSRILMEAIYDPQAKFPHAPPGKYYVVDGGFTNMQGFLAPYHNIRYLLSDFRSDGRPRDKKEIFNYIHSSLRNVIERSFGVLKARFPILKKMPPYPFHVQRSIVVASMAVHNFIRKEGIADALFRQYDSDAILIERNDYESIDTPETDGEVDINQQIEMRVVRDAIADAIFLSQTGC